MGPKAGTGAKPARAKRPSGPAEHRWVVDGWHSVATFTHAGGRLVAGERGGYNACAWADDGAVAWTRELRPPAGGARYSQEVRLSVVGDDVLALLTHRNLAYLLDPTTGEIRRELAMPDQTRGLALAPDGERMILRVSTETLLCEFPSLAPIAAFADYTNADEIAVDPGGRWFAVSGHLGIHVYDLAARAKIRTIELDDPPSHLVALPDGRLATGNSTARLRVFDPSGAMVADVDAAPGRVRKPSVNTIAADPRGRYLATGRADGTVDVWTGTGDHVVAFDKHDTTVPDTGALSLSQVGFGAGRLWVSAGKKGQPPGVTAYDLP